MAGVYTLEPSREIRLLDDEAIKILQLNKIDLIIVHMKAVGMDSLHFLKKIKRLFPVVVRIVEILNTGAEDQVPACGANGSIHIEDVE